MSRPTQRLQKLHNDVKLPEELMREMSANPAERKTVANDDDPLSHRNDRKASPRR